MRTKFKFVVNLKIINAFGLIPPSALLARAEDVAE